VKDAYVRRIEEKELPVTIISCGEVLRNDQALDQSEDQKEDLTNGVDQDVTAECTKIKVLFSVCLIHDPAPLEMCNRLLGGNARFRASIDYVVESSTCIPASCRQIPDPWFPR